MPSSKPVYAELVDAVVAELERGTMPWRRPWVVHPATNLFTHRAYQGVNRLLLALAAERRGYASHYWVTERQCARRGGTILRSEADRPVMASSMRWKRYRSRDRSGRPVERWGLAGRSFALYNFEQTRGLGRLIPDAPNLDLWTPTGPERIARSWKDSPPIVVDRERAFYRPSLDLIALPARDQFPEEAGYWSTLFHEMVHSTGHPARCNRFGDPGRDGSFGSPDYAIEELVAEFGAAFLCAEAGIRNLCMQNNASYIDGWLAALGRDKRLLFSAAAKAEQACGLILGRTRDAKARSGGSGADSGPNPATPL